MAEMTPVRCVLRAHASDREAAGARPAGEIWKRLRLWIKRVGFLQHVCRCAGPDGECEWVCTGFTSPIRFREDLRVTIQALGIVPNELRNAPLEDDISSVAYWYQREQHAPFPPLPDGDQDHVGAHVSA